MGINEKYVGDSYVAIVRSGKRYNVASDTDRDRLSERLLQEYQNKESSYEFVRRFEGLNPDAIQILVEACQKLEAGKKIDLESILE